MQAHDPIFGKRPNHTGASTTGRLCKCKDCVKQRQYKKGVIDKLSANKHEVIVGDANVQRVIGELTDEIANILQEYDELDTLIGTKLMDKLYEYKRDIF